jgi:UDP-N-acetylmuramate dehydrogenase
MMILDLQSAALTSLGERFGPRLQSDISLARYTTSRAGGTAEVLLEVHSIDELIEAVVICWTNGFPYHILGGGSNILVSDAGVRGLVLINRTRKVRFEEHLNPPTVWAESGINFGLLARQAAGKGLSGLEWAAGIPGTLGGAIVGNAGAHGSNISCNLHLAEILHRVDLGQSFEARRENWSLEQLEFKYRSSVFKRQPGTAILMAAWLTLERSTPEKVQAKLDEFVAFRRRTQPPGASLGSMFKNPPGDFAGRLIDAAGLKGYRIGDAQISPVHANFFVNLGNAASRDIYGLIQYARQKVSEKFGIWLELEIELIGEW